MTYCRGAITQNTGALTVVLCTRIPDEFIHIVSGDISQSDVGQVTGSVLDVFGGLDTGRREQQREEGRLWRTNKSR